MSGNLVAFFLDIAVLVFLAATIIYVIKLTKSLNDFKAHRREFDGVIANLLSSIDHAERSVKSLKQVSEVEAAELGELIFQSKAMSAELKVINDAGESMAKRLEAAAEKSGRISSKVGKMRGSYASKLKSVRKPVEDTDLPSFMIEDRELDEEVNNGDLPSQAEQELFAALSENKGNINE